MNTDAQLGGVGGGGLRETYVVEPPTCKTGGTVQLLGPLLVPRETRNNAYAEFGGNKQRK